VVSGPKDPVDNQLSNLGVAVCAIDSGISITAEATANGSDSPVESDPSNVESLSLSDSTPGVVHHDWATPPTSPVADRVQHPAVSYHEESERQPRKTGVSTLNLN